MTGRLGSREIPDASARAMAPANGQVVGSRSSPAFPGFRFSPLATAETSGPPVLPRGHPPARLPASAGRRLGAMLVLLAVILFQPCEAGADLVGTVTERDAVAGRTDGELINANPLLLQLRREQPEVLPAILLQLRTSRSDTGRGLDALASMSDEEIELLALNPDLDGLYRESPEAALDLLRLIREAAKQK